MKVFSVFSGVEGMGLGLPKEWEWVGFSEIDKYASMVLKYHYPNVKNYGDICAINWNEVPDFDLLTGGSPCQDFSIAGKRRGLSGSKSSLAWEFIRALRDKQPTYFIWENVKGALSSRGGWDVANLITAFSESGYALWWQVLNAKDFGVPQNRERIFVIGVREGIPKEVFFESEDSGQIETLGTTIGEENTRIGERDAVYGTGGIMASLKASDYRQPKQILYDPFNQVIPKDQKATTTLRTNSNNGNMQIVVKNKGESQHYRLYDEQGLAPTLQSQSGMSSQKHPFVIHKTQYGKHQQDAIYEIYGIAPTIAPGTHASGSHLLKINDGVKVRRLMPIECERLMGWPNNHTKYGINEKGETIEISDSQRYKMCGNGVVSPCIKAIIENVL